MCLLFFAYICLSVTKRRLAKSLQTLLKHRTVRRFIYKKPHVDSTKNLIAPLYESLSYCPPNNNAAWGSQVQCNAMTAKYDFAGAKLHHPQRQEPNSLVTYRAVLTYGAFIFSETILMEINNQSIHLSAIVKFCVQFECSCSRTKYTTQFTVSSSSCADTEYI